ncbi:11504_t:CDS:2 [Diversispora eburnea]|uniref:11504_t:CDS:1 n=1 Tax=Diversispora eburnea TaxID=1213867 RepID=A0A9N8YJJ7_9GLOM|nr:11504_t:CDS:2 [Diversispora eburnea]
MDSPCRWKEGDPLYRKLKGPNQWPDEKYIPEFKRTLQTFIKEMTEFSREFVHLISLSLELPYDALDQFLDPPDQQMNRLKAKRDIYILLLHHLFNNFVKYPPQDALDPEDGIQGVGPHKDPWLTFLLQVNDSLGLQVQNHSGDWINVPSIDNTFVVNIGTGLEGVTGGVTVATTHRVLNPSPGSNPRISIPFFQMLSDEVVLKQLDVPEEIKKMARKDVVSDADSTAYREFLSKNVGEGVLRNRITSHRDVGERHYPELL